MPYVRGKYAYFLDKLKGRKEGSGSLLDNCMIVYGSGISDGQRHSHNGESPQLDPAFEDG